MVGPSSRTTRENGAPPGTTATRPSGMPFTMIGANSPPRRGRRRPGKPSGGPAPSNRRPRGGKARRRLSAIMAWTNWSGTLSSFDATRPSRMNHDERLEDVAVLIAHVLREVERRVGRQRRADVRCDEPPRGGAGRGPASIRRCGPSSRETARPAPRASAPGMQTNQARCASTGCGTSAAQTAWTSAAL